MTIMYPSVSAIARMAMTSRLAILVLVSALALPVGAIADSWNFTGSADSISFYIWANGSKQRGIAIQTTNPRSSVGAELITSPLPRGTYTVASNTFTIGNEDQIDSYMQTGPNSPYQLAYADLMATQAFQRKYYANFFTLTVQALLKCNTGSVWGPQNSFSAANAHKNSIVIGCPGNNGVVQQGVGYYWATSL